MSFCLYSSHWPTGMCNLRNLHHETRDNLIPTSPLIISLLAHGYLKFT
ncbi:hypothetical protein JI435_099720 [Parastagonospora nodorum SN15]|uniref:Uncharacterized protein n=1 Tax=Phaeosphaeria nodorum (strain SN15 / ATCC MYA-4574 / FGSC 10173) TaxID=321614 RepID=A0A7U2FDD8_PHANO|nr:hypothetical protein JI435_099720 [Parastagonospora nodorum SN15]